MPSRAECATNWSEPKEILRYSHPHKLKQRPTSPAERQQWSELRVGALASIILKMLFDHLKDERHLLRSAERPQDVADVQLSALREINGRLFLFPYVEEIEIVHYTSHSSKESIPEFLKRTKLKFEKRYQQNTMVVCYVDSFEGGEIQWHEIHQQLCDFLTQQNDPLHQSYTIVLICPEKFNSLQYRGGVVYPYLKVSEPVSVVSSLYAGQSEVDTRPVLRAPKGLISEQNLLMR